MHTIIALLCLLLSAIPGYIGIDRGTPQSPGMYPHYVTLIETEEGQPSRTCATTMHWGPPVGRVITFASGETATVVSVTIPRGGPFATPQEYDVAIITLDRYLATQPCPVWWTFPPALLLGQHATVTGWSLEDGKLVEWIADGMWHTGSGAQGEYAIGVWWANQRGPDGTRSYNLPGDSGSPIFLDGRYIGADSGYWIEPPDAPDLVGTGFTVDDEPYQAGMVDGGVSNALCWLWASFPELCPVFERKAGATVEPTVDERVIVSWSLPSNGSALEQSADLKEWVAVDSPTQDNGNNRSTVVDATNQMFFRIRTDTE